MNGWQLWTSLTWCSSEWVRGEKRFGNWFNPRFIHCHCLCTPLDYPEPKWWWWEAASNQLHARTASPSSSSSILHCYCSPIATFLLILYISYFILGVALASQEYLLKSLCCWCCWCCWWCKDGNNSRVCSFTPRGRCIKSLPPGKREDASTSLSPLPNLLTHSIVKRFSSESSVEKPARSLSAS